MKRFFAVLGLLFSFLCIKAKSIDNDIYKITLSNNIEVILYENFNSPIITIGVIYDVGYLDGDKCKFCIGEITSNLFCDENTKHIFRENGINYNVHVYKNHTELLCKMHPKNLDNALKRIAKRVIATKDISYLKQQLLIENNIDKINDSTVLHDLKCGLLSRDSSSLIFNEDELNNLNNEDVYSFLKQYNTCNIRIIICGSISYKGLMKSMRNSIHHMHKCNQLKSRETNLNSYKTVYIEGKHRNNAIHLCYLYSETFAKMQVYFAIFNALLENKLMGEYQYIIDYNNEQHDTNLQIISLYPKFDISLNELQKIWNVFVLNIINFDLSDVLKNEISMRQKLSENIATTNLDQIYFLIKNALLNNIDIKNIFDISSEITKMNSNEFNDISKKILEKNLLLKIVEKYRALQ